MRSAPEICLDEIVVHIIDPRAAQPLVLSQRSLPLDPAGPLTAYFGAHIARSLGDSTAKAARFATPGVDDASRLCRGLLDGSTDLIDGSVRLAERLCTILRGNASISAGDLVVCLYSEIVDGARGPRCLGLLKLDPARGFRHRTAHDARGLQYVDFDVEPNVLPTTRERLQKCAFVRPSAVQPVPYDMMVLDRQAGPTQADRVARFFVAEFLAAELAYTPHQRSKQFYTCLVGVRNRLRTGGLLDDAAEETLREAIEVAVAARVIDVDAWLDALPLPAAVVAEIDRALAAALPDRTFDVDPDFSRGLLARRFFHGDGGLRVEVLADKYADIVQVQRHDDDPERGSYYEITIRTAQWDEVPRGTRR